MKQDIHDPQVVEFYNVVEEGVINLFGSYDRAAHFFDWECSLDSLWEFARDKYFQGWHAARVARTWYAENVLFQDKHRIKAKIKAAVDKAKAAVKEAYPPTVPVVSVKSVRTNSWREPHVSAKVSAAREARRKQWEASRL